MSEIVTDYFKEQTGDVPNPHLIRKIEAEEIKKKPDISRIELLVSVVQRLIVEYDYQILSESLAYENELKEYTSHFKFKPQREGD